MARAQAISKQRGKIPGNGTASRRRRAFVRDRTWIVERRFRLTRGQTRRLPKTTGLAKLTRSAFRTSLGPSPGIPSGVMTSPWEPERIG